MAHRDWKHSQVEDIGIAFYITHPTP